MPDPENGNGLPEHTAMMHYLYCFIAALALSVVLTPLVRLAALRGGAVVYPRKDRWHKKPTPVLGGVALYATFLAVFALFWDRTGEMLPLAVCSGLIFVLGLVDDIRGLTPQVKFIGQIAIASLLISVGTVVKILPWPVVAYPLTFIWIVGLTNAFNLIDNMDGLSAGVAAISSFALFVFSIPYGNEPVALLSLALAGACSGFLFFNFNPARIFMGDCGSMFLGFTLAALSISGTWKHASSLVVTLLLPVLILGIPILDTAFVSLTRRLRWQPISQGGRDHLSHRLVALGFSEKKSVGILYGLTAISALGMLFFSEISPLVFTVVAVIVCLGLFYFGVFLGHSGTGTAGAVVGSANGLKWRAGTLLVHVQRFVEIIIDLVLIVVAYFASYLIRFEGGVPDLQQTYFIQTLPVVVVVKITVFYWCGLYRTMWRHVGVRDFINIVKAVFLSTFIILTCIFMYSRLQYFSRTVFVIDAMLALILVTGSHFSLRVLREYLESMPRQERKVLLIGAGDAGELALREIRNNPVLKFRVAGFLDDDPFKQKRNIHGVQVLGKIDDIGAVSRKTGAREALISIQSLDEQTLGRIEGVCRSHNVDCRAFSYPGHV